MPFLEFVRVADIHEKRFIGEEFLPIRERLIASQGIYRDHACVVHGILGSAELRGIT